MASANNYVISLLSAQHDRSSFSSGVEALDRYLREKAGQDTRRDITRVFVATLVGSDTVAGFYTLANTGIDVGKVPADLARKLPNYDRIPATLLGRLAVDEKHRGIGLGEFLLADALKRSEKATQEIGSWAVLVRAKDERAKAFYKKYGFEEFADWPMYLFIPMKQIRE